MTANGKKEQQDDDNKKENCDEQFDLADDKKVEKKKILIWRRQSQNLRRALSPPKSRSMHWRTAFALWHTYACLRIYGCTNPPGEEET